MHAPYSVLPLISFIASTEYDMHASSIASTVVVAAQVCGGERLTRPGKCPGKCPDALWALLQRMWAEFPADRPTFVEVAAVLVVLRTRAQERADAELAKKRQLEVSSSSYDMHASSSSYDMHACILLLI